MDAFSEDPTPAHFLGSSRTDKQLRCFFAFVVDQTLVLGDQAWGVRIDGRLVACSLLEQPRRFQKARFASLMALLALVFRASLILPSGSLRRMNSYFRLARAGLPEGTWHYLTMIGARKEFQGRGLGASLLRAHLEAAMQDPGSSGLALDTENRRNIAWYEHQGFELYRTASLPPDGEGNNMPIFSLVCRTGKPGHDLGAVAR